MSIFVTSTGTQDSTSFRIKTILAGRDVRVASAFLGIGAENNILPNTRLICDIGMGGTNPCALEDLSAVLGKNLKYHADLHAKVYISDRGCFVGSANLSNNGVGFLSQANLIEAGVFLEPGHAAAQEAASWFDRIWKASDVVGLTEIQFAKRRWRASNGAPHAPRNHRSFMEALQDRETAAKWKYIVSREEFEDGVLERARSRAHEAEEKAGWRASGNIDIYGDLKGAADLEGYFIGLHRKPDGEVLCQHIRHIENLPDSETGKTNSYFDMLDWSATGIPAPTRKELAISGLFSKAIEASKECYIGRPIDIERLLTVLSTPRT